MSTAKVCGGGGGARATAARSLPAAEKPQRDGSAASIVSAGRADAAGAAPGTARSGAAHSRAASVLSGVGSAAGSVLSGGGSVASRAASALGSARSRLSGASEAVERAQDTRRRARRVLDSLKEESPSDAKSQ